jgi:O-Antigen ligase
MDNLINYGILLAGIIFAFCLPIIWKRSNLGWLNSIAALIIFSYPFERIPSLDTALGTLKLGHLLVGGGFALMGILWLKRDPDFMKTKIHPMTLVLAAFFLLSLPSLVFVSNQSRLLTTLLATLISFGAVFLVLHFTTNIWGKFKILSFISIGILAFSGFQFFGDLIGLPIYFTGIKPIFQSNVFGIPRVHATFNEPAYFANALFLFILMFFLYSVFEKNIFKAESATQIKTKATNVLGQIGSLAQVHYQFVYVMLLLIMLTLFALTIAKSAWLIAPVVLLPVFLLAFFKYNVKYVVGWVSLVSFIGISLFGIILSSSPSLQSIVVDNIFHHLSETLDGRTATAKERSLYLDSAIELLPKNIITGIGPGQFGTAANKMILAGTEDTLAGVKDTSDIITFNVYAEVWLEYGLLSFLSFLSLFGYAIWSNFRASFSRLGQRGETQLMRLVLGFYLVASLLQWFYISPIYINPIFIALGMLLHLDYRQKFLGQNI